MTTRAAHLALLLIASAGCAGPLGATAVYAPYVGTQRAAPLSAPIHVYLGPKQDGSTEFTMDGGQLEFEWYRSYRKVTLIARNRYAAPVVIRWTLPIHENLESPHPIEGIAILPAAPASLGVGPNVLLAQLRWVDMAAAYRVQLKVEFQEPVEGEEYSAWESAH